MADYVLGVHICPHQVRAVALERGARDSRLLLLSELTARFPEGLHDDANPDQASNVMAATLASFVKNLRSPVRTVAVTFDATFLFLAAIPTEPRSAESPLAERVSWELGQFFPGTKLDQFVTDVHVIANPVAQKYDELLIVAIRRDLTRSVRRALEKEGFALHLVDVDHFSTELALKLNYPDTYSRYVALVGIKDFRLDVSLLRNGALESYRYFLLHSKTDAIQHLGTLSRETPGLASIVVYGPALDNGLLVQLRQGSAIVVEALNPLRHVGVAETVQLPESFDSPPYRFAPAIGVALRRD
ncbi:MAG TPA: pilus assembly protein PilM [Bacteroidota bacterium]|nr:pilus assembly protein PilM [Bacteroidota bacterium]